MAGDAPYIVNDSGGAAAATFSITSKVKQVAIRNYHATQVLTVKGKTGNTSAVAAAAATADPAVIGADDNFTIPAGQRAVVLKSGRGVFYSFSVIASGAATTFTAEGTIHKDGQ